MWSYHSSRMPPYSAGFAADGYSLRYRETARSPEPCEFRPGVSNEAFECTRTKACWMKYALAAIVLLLAACQRENAPGLTQEQAEAKLLDQGYTYPTIGPSPEGYTGYAMRHGAKIKVTIGKHGAVTPEPD